MTPTPIGSLTLAQQTADAQATAGPTPEQLKAAKDFEAIFIRQLMSSLEKSSGLTGGDQSGGAVFRSMMVGAFADTAAEGGGIGLRDLILRAMLPPAPQGRPELTGSAAPAGAGQQLSQGAALHAGAFPSDALGGAEPSPGLASEPALGLENLAAHVSERLGVTSRVLTRARSSPMLQTVVVGGQSPPNGTEGNR